jgi:hypothetical protein
MLSQRNYSGISLKETYCIVVKSASRLRRIIKMIRLWVWLSTKSLMPSAYGDFLFSNFNTSRLRRIIKMIRLWVWLSTKSLMPSAYGEKN